MKAEGEQVLCRFHLSNYASVHHRPLFEVIVEEALRERVAGATVLKGVMGFVLCGRFLSESMWSLSNELPVIVEVVDRQQRIAGLLHSLQPHLQQTFVTLERAHVLYYRHRSAFPQLDSSDDREDYPMHPQEGVLLRIFLGDSDKDPDSGHPLYRTLVEKAQSLHLEGATVLHGTMGYGRHSALHAAKLLDLSTGLPVVIEVIDTQEKIDTFLPVVDALVTEGLVTLENVRVLKFNGTGS